MVGSSFAHVMRHLETQANGCKCIHLHQLNKIVIIGVGVLIEPGKGSKTLLTGRPLAASATTIRTLHRSGPWKHVR